MYCTLWLFDVTSNLSKEQLFGSCDAICGVHLDEFFSVQFTSVISVLRHFFLLNVTHFLCLLMFVDQMTLQFVCI